MDLSIATFVRNLIFCDFSGGGSGPLSPPGNALKLKPINNLTCFHHKYLLKDKIIPGLHELFDFSLTVKAAPHECVIRTSQPKA